MWSRFLILIVVLLSTPLFGDPRRDEVDTCLGCHDYHGNHKRPTQTKLGDAYATKAILDYLAGGTSPYGNDLKFPTQWKAP